MAVRPADAYLKQADGKWRKLRDGSTITPPAPPVTPGTIFGMNVGDGNPRATVTLRQTDFGSVPLCRGPYLGSLTQDGATFNATKYLAERSPAKRIIISFDQPVTTILSGSYDATITTWAQSVPSDWWVGLTYKSEPNNHVKTGEYTATQYHDCIVHISQLLASLTSANRVVPTPIVSAPTQYGSGVYFDAAMMPTFSEMGNANAVWCWDNYGNPAGAGSAHDYSLAGGYPPVNQTTDSAYTNLVNKGWVDSFGHYGLTESNTPRRNYDVNEVDRAQWYTDFINSYLNRPQPPKLFCLWEGDGTNWDQKFYTTLMRNTYKGFVATSA